jgi:hypothetical protein
MTVEAVRWPTPVTSADPLFIAQACNWMRRPAAVLLRMIWSAYDAMLFDRPFIDGRDLERSITQLLEPRIRNSMSGDEPFYIQHGPFERETMAKPPAQPPAYDLAFVLRADERVMWPLEAKVLETPNQLASYHRDIQQEFLTCRYAPFSMSGAMLGYLLSGTAEDALTAIEAKLGCVLETVAEFPTRPTRVSRHARSVPIGKAYPDTFDCFHLILDYPGLQRTRHDHSRTPSPRRK